MRACSLLLILGLGFPAVAAKKPVVIFVHGGAWVSGSASQYLGLKAAWNQAGYCPVMAEYKLAPKFKHPSQVAELETLIRTLATQAPAECDAGRIFLVGHSAGAHMIAFWNTHHSSKSVKGFVGLAGIYDLPLLLKKWPAYEEQFVRAEFGSERETASPARLPVKSRTPWLLMHSTDDELVDVGQTANFQKHLQALSVPVQFILLKGRHFGIVDQLARMDSEPARSIRDFISK